MDILINIDNPVQLEKMYRNNKATFKTEFNLLYPQLTDNKLADFWHERLNYESPEISWGSKNELIFVMIVSLLLLVVRICFPAKSMILIKWFPWASRIHAVIIRTLAYTLLPIYSTISV